MSSPNYYLFVLKKVKKPAKFGLILTSYWLRLYDVGDYFTIWMLTIFAITMSMTSGIATAAIVKRLDNIVKLYTQVKRELTWYFCV